MKKVLLASTALVAMSGAAFADVDLSGSAEMGIAGGDSHVETEFHQDIDVTFTLSGETDTGLQFGAAIDIDEASNDFDSGGGADPDTDSATGDDSRHGGVAVFVSGTFGTVTLGDTDGAYDKALNEAIIGGTIDDVHEHAGYNGNGGLDGTHDGQILRYDYSFDTFAFAVSVEQDDGVNGSGSGDNVLGLGASGTVGNFGFGIGFQDDGTDDVVGLSADATFGDITAIVNWSDGAVMGSGSDDSHIGLAVGYTSGPLTVAANWGEYDTADSSGIGLVVNYDLGGGAVVQAGWADSDVAGASTSDWSLGLAMSF